MKLADDPGKVIEAATKAVVGPLLIGTQAITWAEGEGMDIEDFLLTVPTASQPSFYLSFSGSVRADAIRESGSGEAVEHFRLYGVITESMSFRKIYRRLFNHFLKNPIFQVKDEEEEDVVKTRLASIEMFDGEVLYVNDKDMKYKALFFDFFITIK